MDPSTPLLPAEQRFVDALHAEEPCYLIPFDSDPTAEDMARWDDPDRKIRAEFLRPLLLRLHPDLRPDVLHLRGAHITDRLDLTGACIDPNLLLPYCRIDNAQFGAATFTGYAEFSGTTFTGDAEFSGATFTKSVSFAEATFTGDARFHAAIFTEYAGFNKATFTGDATFMGAEFIEDVGFGSATFTQGAEFGGAAFIGNVGFGSATFTQGAEFRSAIFTEYAGFGSATFTQGAEFSGTIFTGTAAFAGATFTGNAGFGGAAFIGVAWFAGAAFTGDAGFSGACAKAFDFTGADFHRSDLDPLFGGSVDLKGATFHERVRLSALCLRMSMQHTQLRSGGHLQIHAADIVAEGAAFLGRTILADPGPSIFAEVSTSNVASRSLEHWVRQGQPARQARDALTRTLTALASAGRTTTVTSLRMANVGELVLSSVELDRCHFAGAHGLDKLRIEASCQLAWMPKWRRWRPWRYTSRRVIAEELDWRHRYASWNRGGPEQFPPPPAAEIAGIYRDLRKGLEDNKNEPGAADFFYGEMEMRRLGYREKSDPPASRAERWLLHAYWAVSGYGLRAWRAFTAVALLILAAALVFWTIGIAPPIGTTTKADSVDLTTGAINYPPQQPTVDGFWDALELAFRNSIALLRNPGPVPELTQVGAVTDVLLRLLTPVLLGFALLALRGRTKR